LIDSGDSDDPIARQFIPSAEELVTQPASAPIRSGSRPFAGRGHRASLSRSGAVEAGPCLRGVLPFLLSPRNGRAGQGDRAGACRLSRCARLYPRHREIWEVILTGGDPLMLTPRRLTEVMADLAAIDHVKIIRIHTRVPVVDPARISAG